jgi:hypothetical protein
MICSAKFHINRDNPKECRISNSMNLAPESEFTQEATRVCLRLRLEEDEESKASFEIRMSRKEALRLGLSLVRYGETILESEKDSVIPAESYLR